MQQLNNAYWVYFKFEKNTSRFFPAEKCALKESFNNDVASVLKGTQVCASTSGDWLKEALFAPPGILIALSQVIEKE